jgi:hypothetical protein
MKKHHSKKAAATTSALTTSQSFTVDDIDINGFDDHNSVATAISKEENVAVDSSSSVDETDTKKASSRSESSLARLDHDADDKIDNAIDDDDSYSSDDTVDPVWIGNREENSNMVQKDEDTNVDLFKGGAALTTNDSLEDPIQQVQIKSGTMDHPSMDNTSLIEDDSSITSTMIDDDSIPSEERDESKSVKLLPDTKAVSESEVESEFPPATHQTTSSKEASPDQGDGGNVDKAEEMNRSGKHAKTSAKKKENHNVGSSSQSLKVPKTHKDQRPMPISAEVATGTSTSVENDDDGDGVGQVPQTVSEHANLGIPFSSTDQAGQSEDSPSHSTETSYWGKKSVDKERKDGVSSGMEQDNKANSIFVRSFRTKLSKKGPSGILPTIEVDPPATQDDQDMLDESCDQRLDASRFPDLRSHRPVMSPSRWWRH